MALTQEQLKARDGKLTASRVGVLMNGDAEKVLNLWKEMIGDPSYVPEDLSGVWPVQLGSHTESIHLDWYERQTGRKLSRRGEVVLRGRWMACTLDAFDETIDVPVEAKHVGAFQKLPDIIARYQAQLHWQMLCVEKSKAILTVIFGANEPLQQEIDFDGEYAAELMRRAEAFMACVDSLTPPVALPQIAAPIPHDEMREIDFTGNNNWAVHAASWIEQKDAAKLFEASAKEIKALVPDDCKKATGYGVVVSRSKNNSLTIKGEKL